MELLIDLVAFNILATIGIIVILLTEGDRRWFAPHDSLKARTEPSGLVDDAIVLDCGHVSRTWAKGLDGISRCSDCYHKAILESQTPPGRRG